MKPEEKKLLKKEIIKEIRSELYQYTRYPIMMQSEASLKTANVLLKFGRKVEKIIGQKLK